MDILEEKRKKLRELRERRQQSRGPVSADQRDDLASHLLSSSNTEHLANPVEMINISTQTEGLSDSKEDVLALPTILTYEQAVQTDPVDLTEKSIQLDSEIESSTTTTTVSSDENSSRPELAETSPHSVRIVEPFVINNQALTVGVRSFSLLEALDKSKASLTEKEFRDAEHFCISHTLGSKIEVKTGIENRCVWVDYYAELALVVCQDASESSQGPVISCTMVSVYKFSTGELVDTVEFKGQAILRGQFIRRKRSTVTSALLTSYNGKTILYEIRAVSQPDGALNIERNLIVRNFHHYPVFALWQHHIDSPRVLVGSTDGSISDLDILKMDFYQTSDTDAHFKILPVSSSSLILTDDSSSELPSGFRKQLQKQSCYDETAITSLVTMPHDPTIIYAGCEDGGIYKINLSDVKSGIVRIDTENNGFTPPNAGESEDIFHTFPITGLCQCVNAPNLLLSFGMDWECKIWDVFNNRRLATIELDYPIIRGEWVSYEDTFSIFILTPAALSVYNPMVTLEFTESGSISWRVLNKPVEIFSINVSHFDEFTYFTSFTVLEENGQFYALLGGDCPHQLCVQVNMQR
ncbi:LAME_0F06568g1_1 [Lachancea meyersii CBS 8951]|uniref:LAME_0F06568g1_1 n=1 Tax=Lachancea meyersii CBS 8951 TaxID=1266667 RepID=A0A1G4JTJ7_9SACH|nr:LAME_0F06568g1_1 [Lachancea meyersii CBS 8951]